MTKTRSDDGLFGPGSVTWKVHAHPVMIVGGLRALIIQALHPLALAGVVQHSNYQDDPLRRLRGTARYVHEVVFGDTETAREAAARVRRIHTRVQGVDTVTGKPYSANDPQTMLWVHCGEVHSFLTAYRVYGGGLSRAERDRYLAEQVAAAELIGIPRDMVPGSVAEFRTYFRDVQGDLCSSEDALATVSFVRRPPLPGSLALLRPAGQVLGQAATALVPRSLRAMAGVGEPGPGDLPAGAAVVAASRALLLGRRLPLIGQAVEAPVRRLYGIGRIPSLRTP